MSNNQSDIEWESNLDESSSKDANSHISNLFYEADDNMQTDPEKAI